MQYRTYRPSDCAALAALFRQTVYQRNLRDYTPAQCQAWAPEELDLDAWNANFLANETLVAVSGQQFAGFADIDPTGYLDHLFVHPDFQRQGVATALRDQLERRFDVITTHASITARPFFLQRGYTVRCRQEVCRRGQWLTRFEMVKVRHTQR